MEDKQIHDMISSAVKVDGEVSKAERIKGWLILD